jgi:hypothetical protein
MASDFVGSLSKGNARIMKLKEYLRGMIKLIRLDGGNMENCQILRTCGAMIKGY